MMYWFKKRIRESYYEKGLTLENLRVKTGQTWRLDWINPSMIKEQPVTLQEEYDLRSFDLINIYWTSLCRDMIGRRAAGLRILRCPLKNRAGFPQYIQYGEDLRLFV